MATRVNKSFLYILTFAVLAISLAALAGPRLWPLMQRSGNPKKLVEDGNAALAANDLEKARDSFAAASNADPTNTEILLKLGDVQHKLTPTDPAYLQMAQNSWYKAITIDPRYAPALERLLSSYWDTLDLIPALREDKTALFDRTREVAAKLSAVQPDNKDAAAKKQIVLARQWYEKQNVPTQDLTVAMRAIQELMKSDPANAELPRYLALVRIKQVQPLIDQGQKGAAQDTFDLDVTKMFDDACRAQPNNAAMQYRAYQIYSYLWLAVDPRTKDDTDPQHPKDDRYKVRAEKAILAAQKAATDAEPLYSEIQVSCADWYQRDGKPEEAEKVIKNFYTTHPDDQRARLVYARVLAAKPEGRAEAERILGLDLSSKEDVAGFKALVLRDLQGQTLHELVMMKLSDYAAAKEQPKKDQLVKDMDDAIDKLRRLSSAKSPRVLDLQGRLDLVRGQDVAAVKTLEEAVAQMPPDRPDYEVMVLLSNAYIKTQQPGTAKVLLERVVTGLPASSTWTAPRMALVRLLLQEGDVIAAKRHLDRLHQQKVEGKEITELDNMLGVMAGRTGDVNASTEGYAKLPEDTREQRQRKAQVAGVLGKPDEAVRILRLMVSTDPHEVRAWTAMASIFDMRGQRPRARDVVAEAQAANPDDTSLKFMSLHLSDAKPEQLYTEAKKLIEANPDEFLRELQWYDLEHGPAGHPELALAHLERAQQLKPSDLRVLDLLYQNYVQAKRWDKADAAVARLAELNADQCNGLLYRERLAVAKGDYDNAENLAKRLVEQYGDFAASWLAQAQVQQARGRFADAVNSYIEVRKKQPTQYEALRGLIECYYQLPPEGIEKAKLLLREGRQKFPEDITLREMFLNHLVNYENPLDAIPDRKKLLEAHPEEAGYYLALAATYFHAARHLSLAPSNDRVQANVQLAEAFNTLNAGRERFPDDARFYGQMAEMYQFANKTDQALRVVDEFSKREAVRDTAIPYLLQSDIWARAREWGRLEASLSDALVHAASNENKVDIRLRLASAMVQNKKYPQALATLDGAGDDPRAVRQRIEVLIASGDLAHAQAACMETLAKQDSADVRNLLASVLIDTGHVAEAQQQLLKAQDLDSRNVITKYLHALSLAKQPQPDIEGAINELIGLRTSDPRNGQVRLLLAELYRTTARGDYAIRELVDGLERTPLNKEIRLQLIDMYRGQRPPNNAAARRLLDEAEKDPALSGDIDWYRRDVVLSVAEQNFERAIMIMTEMVIARDPNNMEYRREFLDILLQMKNYPAVLRESDTIVKAGKDAWWLRHQRGLAYAKSTPPEIAKALAEFDQALALCDRGNDPATAEFVMRGIAGAVRPGGEDEAIKRTLPRLAADADNRWHLLLAAMYRTKGDWNNATRTVEAMLADPVNKPADRRVPVLRAAADIYQNNPAPNLDKCRATYIELLSLQPNDLPSLNNLAYLFSESLSPPKPEQAKVYSARAYDISRMSGSPNDLIYDTHGWVLTLCGKDDAADGLKILQGVVERRKDFAEGQYHLGVSLMRQPAPQYKQAAEHLQAALKILDLAEKDGQDVDPKLKDKIQANLISAKEKSASK